MNSIENNFFKRSISEYRNDYIENNDMRLCEVKLTSDDESAKMLATCMQNSDRDSFIIIDRVAREFGDDEKQHDKYSPGICMKYGNEKLDLSVVFIITFKGDAYLLTNNYFFGYNSMINLIFGGQRNFQSCCEVESIRINSNQGDITPFINVIAEMG